MTYARRSTSWFSNATNSADNFVNDPVVDYTGKLSTRVLIFNQANMNAMIIVQDGGYVNAAKSFTNNRSFNVNSSDKFFKRYTF